jgi:AmmeMemoRadiSam system protein A
MITTTRLLTEDQRQVALDVARGAIVARLAGHAFSVPSGLPFPAASGAFVTVKIAGELRGCLGTLECRAGLLEEIARCAADAATEDPRFAPIRPEQLPLLSVEISVLDPLHRLDPFSLDDIVIGLHGLVVEQGRHRGLLLPQVASERRWTAEQFVRQTCVKANLPPDAWLHGATVYRFGAQVFGSDQSGR